MREDGKGLINWSLVGIVISVVMLLLIIAGLFQSCGMRKVETQIAKTEVKSENEGSASGKETNQTTSSTVSNAVEKKDITNESTSTKVKEKIGSDGKVIERTTTTKKSNTVNKSQKSKSSAESLKTFQYKTFKTSYRETITIHTKDKSKVSETSNEYLYIVIALLGGLSIWLGFKKKG